MIESLDALPVDNPFAGIALYRDVQNRCTVDAAGRTLYGYGFRGQGIDRNHSADALYGRYHGGRLLQEVRRLEDGQHHSTRDFSFSSTRPAHFCVSLIIIQSKKKH